MLWLLLACDGKLPVDSAPPESPVDSEALPPAWPSLSRAPGYESSEDAYATGLAWADIDGDGDADMLVAAGNDMRRESLMMYNNVDGVVASEPSWLSQELGYFGHIDVADFNGDGWPDLAVSRFLGDERFGDPGAVEVFLNQRGALPETPDWVSPPLYSFSCAAGDLDRDGDADLAVAVGEPYYADPGRSVVFANDGRGGFGEAPAWTADEPRHSMDVAWVDLDRDGWLDLAFANIGGPHTVHFNQGGALRISPDWVAPGEPEAFEGNSIDWGDVDGDGWFDLVISDNTQLGGAGSVSLYCGPALDRCWESVDGPLHNSAVSLEDLDGDGDLDLFAGAWWGALRVYENAGGLSARPAWTSDTTSVIEAFAWEDLDGSHRGVLTLRGEGLLEVPGHARVLSVTGGVAAGGWISGPGAISAEVLTPAPRDLAVTNWDPNVGDHIYFRQ